MKMKSVHPWQRELRAARSAMRGTPTAAGLVLDALLWWPYWGRGQREEARGAPSPKHPGALPTSGGEEG